MAEGKLVLYIQENNLEEEPAFKCWFPNVIKKQGCVLSNLKSK